MPSRPEQFGTWLAGIGAVTIAVGLLPMRLGRIGLFRLPGDFEFGGRNRRVYFPLGTRASSCR